VTAMPAIFPKNFIYDFPKYPLLARFSTEYLYAL
jgi:hypothetical protein